MAFQQMDHAAGKRGIISEVMPRLAFIVWVMQLKGGIIWRFQEELFQQFDK